MSVNRAPGFHGTMLTAELPVSCISTCISSTGVNRAHLQQAVSTDTQDGRANPRQLQRLHHNNHIQLSIKQLNMNVKVFTFYFSVVAFIIIFYLLHFVGKFNSSQ